MQAACFRFSFRPGPQMSTKTLRQQPTRRERHFDGREVICFVDRPRDVYGAFAASARARPEKIALRFGEQSWTYSELDSEVTRLSAGLTGLGGRQGDRIGLLISNSPDFVLLFLAVQRIGAVAVPMDTRQQGAEVAHCVGNSETSLLFHDAALADRLPATLTCRRFPVESGAALFPDAAVADAPPPASPAEEDAAVILYTSGTTGKPKGAVLTHLNISHSTLHHVGNLGLRDDDCCVVSVPLTHVTGVICGITAPFWTGATLILLPRFKAREFLEAAARWRMTYTIMVPTMYNLCVLDDQFDSFDLSSWRLGHYGASLMPEKTLAALRSKLPDLVLVNGYGATETCSPALMTPVGLGEQPLDTAGQPLPCVEIRVSDPETLAEVPAGTTGEIWIRGPNVTPGYWRNPEANAAGFVDGYWRSGDVGRLRPDGHVEILDRLKDVINRGGYKIYCAEVEQVLTQIDGVTEAAIVPVPDPVLGERVHAFVRLDRDIPAETLRQYCADRLSDFKVPEVFHTGAEALPRNTLGKIAKLTLRNAALNFVQKEHSEP